MKRQLDEKSFVYKILKKKYPEGVVFEEEYHEGGYYDRAYTEYFVDGKVIPDMTSTGSYQ